MKKTIVFLLAAGLVLLLACHKQADPDKTGGGYWTIPTNLIGPDSTYSYPINFTARHSLNNYAVLSGMDAQVTSPNSMVDSLNFWFLTMPSSDSARYRIVEMTDTTKLQAGDIGVTVRMVSRGNFFSSGVAVDSIPDSLDVLVNSGKIQVNIPQIILANASHNSTDSLLLLGYVLVEK
jgi:hypothetical protein